MIRFCCVLCGEKIGVREQLSGKRIKCPKCSGICVVPNKSPQIKFHCESCGQSIRVPQVHTGKKGRCPKCKQIVIVPSLKAGMVDGSGTVTIVCPMCNETIQAPEGSKEQFMECPGCSSYMEAPSGSVKARLAESGPSIPAGADDGSYEEESDVPQESAGAGRRLILAISGAAAVVVVGLIILITVILRSGSGQVGKPVVPPRQEVGDTDLRPQPVTSETQPTEPIVQELPREKTLPKESISSDQELFKETKIAFASDRDGNYEIYIMNADGSGLKRLTNNADDDLFTSWSPDARKIAFESRRDGNPEIYVMNADGSEQANLTNNSSRDHHPSWSPDGKKIAFYSLKDENYEIYVMNPDGSKQKRLTNNRAHDMGPSWSPDGKKIAFRSDRDGNREIYIMGDDGSEHKRLTNNLAIDWMPVWSPDGKKIAFTSNRDKDFEIYVMNADGSEQRRLTNHPANEGNASWSPDGKKIAFVSNRDGNREIYVMNADGGEQTRLTNNPAEDRWPAWLPFLASRSRPVEKPEGRRDRQKVADTDLRPQPVTSGEIDAARSSDLKLRLKPRQKYNLRIIREDKVSLAMMGQRQDIRSISTVDLEFEVEQVDANSVAWLKVTYLALREKGGSAAGTMEYDSTKPDVATDYAFASTYSAMIGQSFVMKVTPDGKMLELQGIDEMFLRMAEKIVEGEDESIRKRAMERTAEGAEEMAERYIEVLNQKYGSRKKREESVRDLIKKNPFFTNEKIRGMVGNVIMSFPGGPAGIGDSWQGRAVLPAAAPVDIDLTYTLKERKQGVAVIDISSKIELVDEPASTSDSPLGLTKVSLTGSYEGSLQIDPNSGWMIRKKATMRCSGNMKMASNQQMPQATTMPVSMETVTTVEPIE